MSRAPSTMGIPFVDFTKYPEEKNMKVIEWASSAPEWRHTRPGLSVEGNCSTLSCKALGKSTICNWGLGKKFDLGYDSPKVCCPICNCHVDPTTCAFNNCDWKYSGKTWRSYKEGVKPASGGPYSAGDAYHVFDENVTVNWIDLVIETAPRGQWVKGKGSTG